MHPIDKFLAKLDPKLRLKLLKALEDILVLELSQYDVKKLAGHKDFFRVRIGKIRIIFRKIPQEQGLLISIDFRGKAYQDL